MINRGATPGLAFECETRDILKPVLNYKGSKRKYCPSERYGEEQPSNRVSTSLRLRRMRSEMTRVASVQGPPLEGYIVTSDDAHQSEFIDPRDMRREYITGFSGSAGNALITVDKAVLWTDGRYHLQADEQLDCNWMLMKQQHEYVPSITKWLINEYQGKSARIGADPTLIPASTWESWHRQLKNSSVQLVPVPNNIVDLIWQVDRPPYNQYTAYPLEDKYTGKPWQEKVNQVRQQMVFNSADALVLTALDEIAWLLNIRGHDLPHTPVLRAYAVITLGAIHLYAPRYKLRLAIDEHLKMAACYHADCVRLHNYTAIWDDLKTMAQAWSKVWLPSRCGYAHGASRQIYTSIPEDKWIVRASPIIDLRAEKNEVEARGMRTAHLRDAVAMCDFLAYMEEQIELETEGWDELQVARVANEFRREQALLEDISFPTVAGYGKHAALPHYEPTNATNLKIGNASTLVVDSGGQYRDGTTDVTRTLHYGEPTREQKEAYTRVLIGSIQLSSIIFPSNLRTYQLDPFARAPIWNTGQDYMHGTGHGIGHFLSVHEPPISVSYYQRKSTNAACNDETLKPGYFLSNEPGYYKEGDFGVRLENVMEVVLSAKPKLLGQHFLKFREATLVPYEPKLIDLDMLSPQHRRWLNGYNKRIRDEVGPELKARLRMKGFLWMMEKTRSIPERGPVNPNFFLGLSPSHSHVTKYNLQLLIVLCIIQFYKSFRNIA